MGYLLNEYGLYKIKNNKKIRIEIKTKKDIFKILDVIYLDPEFR